MMHRDEGSPRAADSSKGRRASVPALPGLGSSMGRATGPREARVPRDSTTDFAEFIKSTGPAGGDRNTACKVATPTSPTNSSTDSRRGRFQPRDAAVDSKADNSDLIDFIRQGPPIAASGHRIPRHVAPFRTTMDSDQMSGAVGGKAVDATIPEIRYSQASTNMTDNSMPSMQSSTNSSSALIKNKGPAPGAAHVFDDDGVMPQRKQRRVRDPYAMDFSDDEGDEDEAMVETPRLPVKKEESLAEFLRNYDPPPEPPSSPPRPPKKKASAPSLIGRFTRGNRDAKEPAVAPDGPLRSSSSRGGRGGYIPLQVNVPASPDRWVPADVGGDRPRPAATTSGRVPMKKYEPREAVSTSRSGTADLAAFLRDSAPPDSAVAGPAARPPSRHDEGGGGGGIAKMFGRRKKS